MSDECMKRHGWGRFERFLDRLFTRGVGCEEIEAVLDDTPRSGYELIKAVEVAHPKARLGVPSLYVHLHTLVAEERAIWHPPTGTPPRARYTRAKGGA